VTENKYERGDLRRVATAVEYGRDGSKRRMIITIDV
jgi:hypothetical protein